MITLKKPRKKDNGSYEYRVTCPTCKSKSADVNPSVNVWNCFKCPSGGAVPPEWLTGFTGAELEALHYAVAARYQPGTFSDLPAAARLEIERRGFNPDVLVDEYGVVWDGERLAWPAGEGWCRRSVFPWESPKTLTVSPKGWIGQQRMVRGAHLVITEGDYKAASIPSPWVGVAAMGTMLTPEQVAILRHSEPASVRIMLDVGYIWESLNMQKALLPLQSRVCILEGPDSSGPDDQPRSQILSLLLNS